MEMTSIPKNMKKKDLDFLVNEQLHILGCKINSAKETAEVVFPSIRYAAQFIKTSFYFNSIEQMKHPYYGEGKKLANKVIFLGSQIQFKVKKGLLNEGKEASNDRYGQ